MSNLKLDIQDNAEGSLIDTEGHQDSPRLSIVTASEVTTIVPVGEPAYAEGAANDAVQAPNETDKIDGDRPLLDEAGRPIIYQEPGRLQEVIRSAEGSLARTGRHFQRNGQIVAIQTDPATGEAAVQPLDSLALLHDLAGASAWRKFSASQNEWLPTDPVERICRVMVRAGRFDRLQPLVGIARQPFLRPDGTLCDRAGYDAATGMFGVFDEAGFEVPEVPTRAQAEEALELLGDLLAEFAFGTPSDRSAALAALLTAVTRPSLDLAPMFHVRAPQIASGKTYLCALITALATPQRGSPVGFPGGDEECTKLLLAQLMRSPAVIEFDNLTDDLKPHKSLCTVLTSERMEGRILGRSKVSSVGTRALFLSSGNNVGPVADMTRRCVTINLNPGCEVPATRAFARPDLVAEVRRDRVRYVSAALTVVRAWIVDGRPQSACPTLASFGDWSAWCRQPLLWLGQPDPAVSVFQGMAEDPERELLGLLLDRWYAQFGDDPVMVRDVVARAAAGLVGAEDLAEVLQEVAGDRGRVNNRKLGKWITQRAGRIVDGRRLVRAPKTRNAENWRVESVTSVVSVSSPPAADARSPTP